MKIHICVYDSSGLDIGYSLAIILKFGFLSLQCPKISTQPRTQAL
jgi:hypothetical protein